MPKKPQQPQIIERVISFDHDNKTVDILPVTHIDHERVLAGDRSIPLPDLVQYISPHGRVYVLNAPEWYVNETKHLATVEMSNVIRQAVNYQRPGAAKPDNPFLKILPWIIAGAALIGMLVKK